MPSSRCLRLPVCIYNVVQTSRFLLPNFEPFLFKAKSRCSLFVNLTKASQLGRPLGFIHISMPPLTKMIKIYYYNRICMVIKATGDGSDKQRYLYHFTTALARWRLNITSQQLSRDRGYKQHFTTALARRRLNITSQQLLRDVG